MSVIRFARTPPLPPSPTGRFRAGAASVDVTPAWGLAMAGYATEGERAWGFQGRLRARALYFEDARGERAAVVAADLHAASRYLLERVALETAPACGISVDRLLLAGTHTHTAPGNFYGNTLFDSTAQRSMGFDQGYADWVSGRIAAAVKRAAGAARPATVGFGTRTLWGVSRNRSLTPFLANNDASRWWDRGWPGAGAPSGLALESRAVDPRVRVVAAFEVEDGGLIGALGLFGCHNTALGPDGDVLDADWAGRAAARAEALHSGSGRGPVVALGLAGAGDVTARTEGTGGRGVELARLLGERVADVLGAAVAEARERRQDLPLLEVRFADPRVAGSRVGEREDTRLAADWDYGAPTLGGSEESRTVFHHLGLVREGMPGDHFSQGHPQHPKVRALGVLQEAVGFLAGLKPAPRWPLHVARLGTGVLATVPGEPTAMAALRIERTLAGLDDVDQVAVLGYAGDYGGYFTTEEEYHHQHYEGSSTLYGRNSTRHLSQRLRLVAAGGAEPFDPGREVRFDVGARIQAFTAESEGPAVGPVVPAISRKGQHVEVRWRMPAKVRLSFAESFFVLLTERREGVWRPVRVGDRDFDDRSREMLVRVFKPAFDPLPGIHGWGVDLWLPEGLDDDVPLRIEVAPRGPFPGFRADLP